MYYNPPRHVTAQPGLLHTVPVHQVHRPHQQRIPPPRAKASSGDEHVHPEDMILSTEATRLINRVYEPQRVGAEYGEVC